MAVAAELDFSADKAVTTAVICDADGLADRFFAAFSTWLRDFDSVSTWPDTEPPPAALSAVSCVWMLVRSVLICLDAPAFNWRWVRLPSEVVSDATCLHVAADAVTVVVGVADELAGAVVGGAGVPLEPLEPELHAASNAAPPASTIAAPIRAGLAFDCVVMVHMLPTRQYRDVTLDGRDQLRRNAATMRACQMYPTCPEYHDCHDYRY